MAIRLESASNAVRSTASIKGGRGSLVGKGVSSFGLEVKSPRQIGFEPVSDRGFKSVRPIEVKTFPNNIPEIGSDSGPTVSHPENSTPGSNLVKLLGDLLIPRGADVAQPQVVTETIYFPKPSSEPTPVVESASKPTTIVESQVETGNQTVYSPVTPEVMQAEARPATRIVVEPVARIPEVSTPEAKPDLLAQSQQSLIARLRMSRLLTRARVQPLAAPAAETSSVTETQPQTSPVTKVVNKTETAIQPRTVEPTRNTRTKVESLGFLRKSYLEEMKRRTYKEKAHDVNAKRKSVLEQTFDVMAPENPDGIVGEAFRQKSQVADGQNNEEIKSPIFFQRGEPYRIDGGLERLGEALKLMSVVRRDQLGELVEKNTAIRETNRPPEDAPTSEQVDNVLNPIKTLFTQTEPLVIEIKEVVKDSVIESVKFDPREQVVYNSEPAVEPKATEGLVDPAISNIADFPSRLLGLIEYIGDRMVGETMETVEALKRRELVLAA